MKNRKRFFCCLLIVVLAAVIFFGVTACSDDDTGPVRLRGNVIIPNELMLGKSITADTDDLRGTGSLSFQWQSSDSATGTFIDITGANDSSFLLTKEDFVVDVGRFIRVNVKRAGREGSINSNAAGIYESAMINTVVINFTGDGVTAGSNYDLKATVTYDFNKTDIFQQVLWSVKNTTSVNTAIGKYTGRLTVGINESATIVVRAESVYDSAAFHELTLAVGAVQMILPLSIASFEVREADPLENSGKTLQSGQVNPPGGGGNAYFMQNAKAPTDGIAGKGRYEVYFNLSDFVDMTPYRFLTYEIMADNWFILNDIDEHYPRFRSAVEDVHDIFIQYNSGNAYRDVVEKVLDGAPENTWGRVVVPIDSSAPIHETGPLASYSAVMSEANVIALRYITKASGGIEGRIYFRNLQLHMTAP